MNKITIVTVGFAEGGIETRVKYLISVISKYDVEVNLICDLKDKEDAYQFKNNNNLKFNISPIHLRTYNYFLILLNLINELIKNRPDTIISFHNKTNTIVPIIAFLFFIKKRIVHIDSFARKQWRLNQNSGLYIFIYNFLNQINYLFANSIIIASKALRKEISFANKKDIRVIYGFVRENDDAKSEDITVPFDSEEYFKIIYNGRINIDKGFDVLVESFIKLQKNYSRIRLIVLGSTESSFYQKIEKQIKEENLNEKVVFLGYVKNVYPYIRKSNLLVLPSRTESFGYAILEAWEVGIPVIASNVEGPAEIIENYKNGILFNVGDVDDLCSKIKLVIDSQIDLISMNESAKKGLAERFSEKVFSAEWVNLLDI